MSKPRPNPIHVISLGAGVQSSTLALMASQGQISPTPSEAIFANTHSESEATYRYLAWLREVLAFPVREVDNGSLWDDVGKLVPTATEKRQIANRVLPIFYHANGQTNMAQRRCTHNYKLTPIRRHVRKYFERGVVQWIGISTDEATRMRDSEVNYVQNRYPLIEMDMSRTDCIEWLKSNGYPVPPKSSCVFCPFHDDNTWKEMKYNRPADVRRAVELEKRIQANEARSDYEPYTPFLHRSLIPLDEVIFKHEKQINLFENECYGMCGN